MPAAVKHAGRRAMGTLNDMHCHLGFMANAAEVAAQALTHDMLIFNNTITPEDWLEEQRKLTPFPNVTTGFGMHPWWVTNGAADSARCLELLDRWEPLVLGEVGLDLGKRHQETAVDQKRVFTDITRWAGAKGNRLISLHCVHAAADVLETLESQGALEGCTCLFHWFTGPSDSLKRAIQAGCYFSCGPRMLRTGKGREYVKAIPAKQLLLETDWPPQQGDHCTYEELQEQLGIAAQAIAAIKGEEALAVIATTSQQLLASHSPLSKGIDANTDIGSEPQR